MLPHLLLIASLLIFFISWLHEPRRLINGVLFTVCLFCLGGWLTQLVFSSKNRALTIGYWTFIGLGLAAASLLIVFGWHRYLPAWVNWLALPIPSILIYLSLTAYNFLINLLPYQFVPCHYQQVQLGRPMPKFIMSGGQGPDEQLSEAAAMKNYAAEHGISQEMILLEDQSTNTLQNMKFSKTVAEKDFGSNHFKAAFFSSNFHILRAGLLARQVNLQANGIGARTRFYYLPNAIIREKGSGVRDEQKTSFNCYHSFKHPHFRGSCFEQLRHSLILGASLCWNLKTFAKTTKPGRQ